MHYCRNVDQWTLLYDEDCGFCRWSLSKFLAWDRNHRLRPLPLQSDEADELLHDMPEKRKMSSWHLVSPEGTVWSAGAGAAPLFRLMPWGGALAIIAELFPGLTEFIYRTVSENRDILAKFLGTQACSVDPQRVAAAHQ